ncbi:MAG: hypothetical protein EOP47_27480 [Sphingobacteriaceae bacterium]|nr:MAG: hypothetical protein EOP47_27480 [Sphingobacteriaceae bacterium]
MVINLQYYWEDMIGLALIPVTLVLFVVFIILLVMLFVMITRIIKQRSGDKISTAVTAILGVVLLLVLIFPGGIVDFSKYENNILVATREGSANCTTTFKFKADGKFSETSVCFGIERINGTYRLSRDTINLYYNQESKSNFSRAIIKYDKKKTGHNLGEVLLYKNIHDTVSFPLTITKYAFKK